jgi:hypothetical protein
MKAWGFKGFQPLPPPYWPAKERDGVILSVVVRENEVTSLSPLVLLCKGEAEEIESSP